jgi:hypothetical protein
VPTSWATARSRYDSSCIVRASALRAETHPSLRGSSLRSGREDRRRCL